MDKENKKRLYRLCDPYKTLEVDNECNINIDTHHDDDTLLRGFNWSDRIFNEVSFGDGETIKFFTGYSGSGKTTELKKVQHKLEEDGYLVVYINGDEYMDMTQNIHITDIYNSLIFNVAKKVNPDISFEKDGYLKRMYDFLETEVKIEKVNISGIIMTLKDNPSLRKQISDNMKDNFSSFKKDIKEDLHKLNEQVKTDGKEGIVVIFDSLEKNKGMSINYEEVIKACETTFSNRDNLLMPIDVIYTVPAYLSERINWLNIDFLPAIKVKTKENKPFNKGIELLQELVKKRIKEDELKEIFGDNWENKLKKIISFSGGYVRDLLRILRDVIIQEKYPISDKSFDRILDNERNSYNELADTNILKHLEKVKKNKNIKDIEDTSIKDRLLTNHLILRYRNNDLWFDVHPSFDTIE